jgi:hypothetical protein
MSAARSLLAALVAAIALCAGAGAGTTAATTRIAITVTPGQVDRFELTLTHPGSAVHDVGTVTWQPEGTRILARGGQRVRQWRGVGSFVGKRGRLSLRYRIDWLNAGRGHEAGVGTWTAIDGAGAYASLAGSGRSAHLWLPRGPLASRADGYVRSG